MNSSWLRIVAVITILAIPAMTSLAAETLCRENFDGPAVKSGQSIIDAPLGWTLISPNDPAKQSVGNVFVGSGKYGWGVNEVSMIVAPNGDWVAACRTDNPKRFAHHAFDHYSGLAVSISKDEGKTWSELNTLCEWGRHHPSMVVLPDGRILMSYVVRLGYPSNAEGFPQFGVEAVVSRDNGQTWDLPRRYILAQWAGNVRGEDDWYGGVQSSSTVRLPDGTLLTAFGTGFRNAPGTARCKMDVALVRWRMESPEK